MPISGRKPPPVNFYKRLKENFGEERKKALASLEERVKKGLLERSKWCEEFPLIVDLELTATQASVGKDLLKTHMKDYLRKEGCSSVEIEVEQRQSVREKNMITVHPVITITVKENKND